MLSSRGKNDIELISSSFDFVTLNKVLTIRMVINSGYEEFYVIISG